MKTVKNKLKALKKDKKGFTLAELLIVVAIIAVLVAISIPIFTAQLEKSREATDMANIRAAYAEISAEAITDPDKDHEAVVDLKQTQKDWQTDSTQTIAGVKLSEIADDSNVIAKGGSVTVKYTASDDGSGVVTIGKTEAKSTHVKS